MVRSGFEKEMLTTGMEAAVTTGAAFGAGACTEIQCTNNAKHFYSCMKLDVCYNAITMPIFSVDTSVKNDLSHHAVF